jgi:hypothetical protein
MTINDTGYMLYVGTSATDDPTRAGLVFAAANAAVRFARQQGIALPRVALLGEGVWLMNSEVAKQTIPSGAGRGSLFDLITNFEKAVPDVRILC